MATVAETTPRIQGKYATVYDDAVTIVKVNGQLYVVYEDRIEDFAVEMAPFTVVLGDVEIADTQQMLDRIAGGYAAVACGRAN